MPLMEWIAFTALPPVRVQEKIAFALFFIGTIAFFVWVVWLWWKK